MVILTITLTKEKTVSIPCKLMIKWVNTGWYFGEEYVTLDGIKAVRIFSYICDGETKRDTAQEMARANGYVKGQLCYFGGRPESAQYSFIV